MAFCKYCGKELEAEQLCDCEQAVASRMAKEQPTEIVASQLQEQNKNNGKAFSDKAKAVRSDYAAFAAACRDTFDIVFLDPPYSAGLLMPAVKAVLPLMSDYGVIVCEHPPEVAVEPSVGGFSVYKTYRYGKVLVTVYRKGEEL